MKILSEDLIDEFHLKVKDKFPNISRKQSSEICHGPWRYLKNEMENGDLDNMRLKYFGTFQVYPGRAKIMLEKLEERLATIGQEEYNRLKKILTKFIEGIKNEET